ncbi:ADP-ribosylation factor-like protein 14 [Microcaecilia unicolor]|uniref:ADP-ribosylation factor-like protein 14 n=1 Tax=Microcaecilia unicolor TaxID=1415580 RepID=A0A6P7Z6L6_9AMPH|nr:ADP-ribosylation factor-like protein 14 [Microcaecilia unicolor]
MGLVGSRHSKVRQARILMLGLEAAGKSTLLYKFKFKEPFTTIPTIGFNVEMIETDKDIALTIWDVGGQQKMRTLWCCYFENTDGLVYVVDSTDKKHLEDSKKEFELIIKNELIKNVPVVVLANKQDLPGALNAEEITRKLNMKRYCSDRDWFVQPCCAITGQGLEEGLGKVKEFVKNFMKSKDDAFLISKQSVRLQKLRPVEQRNN